jgi:uncharacterized protein (UPF0332 family)
MGKGIKQKFEECLKAGRIRSLFGSSDLCEKELNVAEEDLNVASHGLDEQRWKWSTIQAYYSMFHSARALLYSEGYREKSHYCLGIAIEALFVETEKIDAKYVDALQMARAMRENADYNDEFSESGARKLVKIAKGFLKAARQQMKKS